MTNISETHQRIGTNHALGQEVIQSTQAECDIYKSAFIQLKAELLKRDEKMQALSGRLNLKTPISVSTQKDFIPAIESTSKMPSTLADHDRFNMNCLQQVIQSCEQERDLYKNALQHLVSDLQLRDGAIKDLEGQVAELDKPTTPPATPFASLATAVDNVKVSFITTPNEKENALRNLTFFLYQRMKKDVDLVKCTIEDPDLLRAANEAFAMIEKNVPENSRTLFLKNLLRSKENSVVHKKKEYENRKSQHTDVIRRVTSEIGIAKALYARFYNMQLKVKNLPSGDANYSNFPFKEIPLLAGQLCLLESIFKELKTELDSTIPKHLEKIKEIEKELGAIYSIRETFFNLLKKCQLAKTN